jgi:hypothetical protein
LPKERGANNKNNDGSKSKIFKAMDMYNTIQSYGGKGGIYV